MRYVDKQINCFSEDHCDSHRCFVIVHNQEPVKAASTIISTTGKAANKRSINLLQKFIEKIPTCTHVLRHRAIIAILRVAVTITKASTTRAVRADGHALLNGLHRPAAGGVPAFAALQRD